MMVKSAFRDLERKVISKGLCARCGICCGVCPADVIRLDTNEYPVLDGKCLKCGLCLKACPGAEVDFPSLSRSIFNAPFTPHDLEGYVEKNYVGYATDSSIRQTGASGGLVTGLLAYLLEKGDINGAIVVQMDEKDPLRSKGMLATNKMALLDSAKSKYCITPSMEALKKIRELDGRFAVVGLPCHVHGLRKLAAADHKLSQKIAYILGLYCHLSLNPNGHREVIQACGIDPSDIKAFNFRGGPWPGGFQVIKKDNTDVILNKIQIRLFMNFMFRLYGCERCFQCIDALCEYADLSFGDFWASDFSGFFSRMTHSTLVSQRTRNGALLIENAVRDKAVVLHELPREKFSKRILNMSRIKKRRAYIKIRKLERKGDHYPNYQFKIPQMSDRGSYQAYLIHRFWEIIRKSMLRKFILQGSLSKAALLFERVNKKKQQFFFNYNAD